jgi:4-hydroxyphenylpyruvate dioxygenase
MSDHLFASYDIDYVEIYTPMAKSLAYWHQQALGFELVACADYETGATNTSSYVLTSGDIRLVLTSAYPSGEQTVNNEIGSFIQQHYCGVKRFGLRVDSVKEAFESAIKNGAIPTRFPTVTSDENGNIEEAAVKLYEYNEIVFINRSAYNGTFKPGYKPRKARAGTMVRPSRLFSIDHIAAELRINEINHWSSQLTRIIGTELVQRISRSEDNRTGMIMNINQSADKRLTLVMAEPETYTGFSKIQQNIDRFGPGIHHIAFLTDDITTVTQELLDKGVEFVGFPPSYYDLLRNSGEFGDIDIDTMQQHGILVDKEEETYLLQKFIKPISDRPFFLYEIVQRINGYDGFALKNINVLKKAEELEIMRAR